MNEDKTMKSVILKKRTNSNLKIQSQLAFNWTQKTLNQEKQCVNKIYFKKLGKWVKPKGNYHLGCMGNKVDI